MNEKLFNEWMQLKYDIQTIAGIVQNDIGISENDLANWLSFVIHFKTKFQDLQDRTAKELKK